MARKQAKTGGLSDMRADIQDVWINDKSKCEYLLGFSWIHNCNGVMELS